MCREMKRRVLEINKADPTAVFSLYVDDLRCRLGYDWFVAQGIDSARVKVSLLSDGTATYNNFYNYFGDPATAQQNWETYAAEVEALDWNHGGRYPETRAEFELESWTWPYYLATRPGYRLVMQNGALLESSCPFITDKLREMQIEDIQPYEMLSALSESARRLFYDMAGFDYDKFAALFDASPKGNLIIIGTSSGFTRFGPFSSIFLCSRSIACKLPIPELTQTPTRNGSSFVMSREESSIAWRAAATANCAKRSILLAAFGSI